MEASTAPTLGEQVHTAEQAYYEQFTCQPTPTDWSTWQHRARVRQLLHHPERLLFSRHVLERHGYSLHRYMATHLSPEAWAHWFTHSSLFASAPT